MTTRVLLGSMSGIFRWKARDAACEAIAAAAALNFNDVHTVDGETWFLAQDAGGLGAPGHLYRYTWSTDTLTDLGVIGTVDPDPDMAAVLALSASRALCAYPDPGGAAVNYGAREYSAGVETDHTVFDAECNCMFRDSSGNVYAAVHDSGDVYQWPGSGTTWTKIVTGHGAGGVPEMGGLAADQIWQAGHSSTYGRIWYWNGSSWTTQLTDARHTSTITGISVVSATDVWACNVKGEILHFDGSTWVVVYTDASVDFYDIRALSAAEVYAVADYGSTSRLYMYDGASWSWVLADGSGASSFSLFVFDAPGGVVPKNEGPYWLINDGRDYEVTDAGQLKREPEITTRCRLRLLARRGEWFGDPLLGSRLHTIRTLKNARRLAEDYIREALQPLVDGGEIVALSVRQIEADHDTGSLGAWVEVVVPGDEVIPLGRVPLGGAQ